VPEFNLEQFIITADRIRRKAIEEGRLTDNPSIQVLRQLVAKQPGVRQTIYGNFIAESEPTSRSAMFTKNSVDNRFGQEEQELLSQCETALDKERLISIDRIVGNKSSNITVRLIVRSALPMLLMVGGTSLYLPRERLKSQPIKYCFSLMKPSRQIRPNHYQRKT